MCNLINSIEAKSFVGYKIVAEKDGKNYSVAMGFCYDDYEEIPIVEEQKRIAYWFIDSILSSYVLNKELMRGRTAVFRYKRQAKKIYLEMLISDTIGEEYKLKLKKAKVSIDLMEGDFTGLDVVAGKKIEFLETIEE